MALPTYVASGTASSGTTSPRTPAYPAGLAADDRLILQVFVRATNATCTTPSGWTYEFEDDVTGYGTQWVFSKLATGSESGTLSVAWTGTTAGFMAIAQIHAFRGVTPVARWYEPGDISLTIGGTVTNMPLVVSTGTDRLALALTAAASGSQTVAAATGETGGNWAEALAEVTSTAGNGGMLQLQTAGLATAVILSGGTSTLSGTVNGSVVRGMALIATGATLAVSAAFLETRAEVTAANSLNAANYITPPEFIAPPGGIVFAHIVAKAATAVTAFANVPADSAGGTWTLVHQNISGTGPSLRAAVFKRAVVGSAVKIDEVSFTASSTPDSMSCVVYSVAGGDINNLNASSALSTTGDPVATLAIAPFSTSTVMCFYGGNGTGSAGTTPTGFTQLITSTIPSQHRYAGYYDAVGPVQSATFSTTNSQSVAILVEIPLPSGVTTGTAARTLAALTGLASGNHIQFSGTGARTLAALTGSATGAAGGVGTAARTLNPLTGAASGVHGVVATASRTLAVLNGSASGSHSAYIGTGVRTLASLTATATATHIPYFGTGAGTVRLAGPGGSEPWSDGTLWSDGTGWSAGPGGTIAVGVHGVVATTTTALVNELAGLSTGVLGVTGTAGRTLAPLTGAAVGLHAIGGVAACTLAPLTGSATGTTGAPIGPFTGTGARTLAALAGAATGLHSIGGTASVQVAPIIGSAAATFVMALGTAARTLAPLTGAATGVHAVGGSAAYTLAALIGNASGIAAQPITGAGARTLPPLDAQAIGIHSVAGTGAQTIAPLTGVAVAGHGVASVAQRNLAPLAGTATGIHAVGGQAVATVAPLVGAATALFGLSTGTAAATLTSTTGVAFGAHGVAAVFGASSRTLAPLTGLATGIHPVGSIGAGIVAPAAGLATGAHGVAGTAARTLAPIAGIAAAVHGSVTGVGAHTLAPLVGLASGVHGVTGTAARILPALTGDALGFHGQPVTGTAARTLAALTGAAAGVHGVVATASRTLAALTGAATAGHGVTGTAARTLVALTGNAAGIHTVTFVGIGTGLVPPVHGLATGVHGVVSTGTATVPSLVGNAVGQIGVSIFGTASAELRPTGIAIGHFEAPIAYIHYVECPITGFQLTKYNAGYDPVRRAYVVEDAADEPEPLPRRPRPLPPVIRLR